ncbi:Uu.00g036060.m01.CDS01 [Anthostomella pinea]|uniref:non-specific serine/threonine protein kinase n=1 Tax=Anthostomella pinea TaxID=933095 RepID=A0AAI8V4G0_9PEZI|nr:Uu.00g036060.m01.CDS01 [Anthostomella pinea]
MIGPSMGTRPYQQPGALPTLGGFNTESEPHCTIPCVLGAVYGSTIYATYKEKDTKTLLKVTGPGAEVKALTYMIYGARDQAVERMTRDCISRGVNAVVAMNFSEGELLGCAQVSVYGTAVYFAKNWLNPQTVDPESLQKSWADLGNKLAILEKDERFDYLRNIVAELRGSRGVLLLYSSRHPQVLNHRDLSGTNILLDQDTHAISGIIDWSLADIQPFGMELRVLRQFSGNMNGNGWSDYACREATDGAFWAEFWKVTGIEDPQVRETTKRNAETACKLGVILQFAFKSTLDGKQTDVLSPKPSSFLKEWLKYPSWSDLVLREEDAARLKAGDANTS